MEDQKEKGRLAVSTEEGEKHSSLDDILEVVETNVSLGLLHSEENSRLNDKRDSVLEVYDYDLVSAVTMGAVNTQLGKYIVRAAGKMGDVLKHSYVVRGAGQSLELAGHTLGKLLDKLDLFNLPAGEAKQSKEQREAWEKACTEYGFVYGYDMALARSAQKAKASILDFEALEETVEVNDGSKVIFRPPFEKIVVIENHINSDGKFKFSRYEQEKNPWLFGTQIRFGVNRDVALEMLPANIRDKVESIGCGKLFSVGMLFLNTNSFEIKTWPSELSNSSVQFKEAFKLFFENLFENINKMSGNFALGYSVLPELSTEEEKQYIATPIDFRHCISPHLDGSGKPTKEKRLYTLNYIAVSDYKKFPKLQTLHWNWVDAGKEGYSQGAFAIRKSRILEFAERQVGEMLRRFLLEPTLRLQVERKTGHIDFRLKNSSNQFHFKDNSFEFVPAPANKYLEGSISDVGGRGNYRFNAKISAEMNKAQEATVQFKINIYYDFTAEVKSVFHNRGKGIFYNKEIIGKWNINIGNNPPDAGKLIITPTIELRDIGTYMDIEDLKLLHVVRDTLRNSKIGISNELDGLVNDFQVQFKKSFNEQSCSWFIPGGDETIYSNPSISKGSDLVFDMRFTD